MFGRGTIDAHSASATGQNRPTCSTSGCLLSPAANILRGKTILDVLAGEKQERAQTGGSVGGAWTNSPGLSKPGDRGQGQLENPLLHHCRERNRYWHLANAILAAPCLCILPGFIEPCLPTGSHRPVHNGPMRYGFRFVCHRDGERVRAFSRTGHQWSAQLPAIAAALRTLPDGKGVICRLGGGYNARRFREVPDSGVEKPGLVSREHRTSLIVSSTSRRRS